MKRILLLVIPATLAACSAESPLLTGMRVSVTVDASSASNCVRVVATPESGTQGATGPIARKEVITVAVYPAKDWSGSVTLVARGYANCDENVDLASFVEESAAVTRTTYDGEVALALSGPAVVDADGDGKSGAEDCDDNDPARFVGNQEFCISAVDNNCSQTVGCADPSCTGGCLANGLGTCEQGVCMGPEQFLCADGQDNDGDGLVDCADPDCTARSCSDGSGCTTGDVCAGDGGCSGTPVVADCTTPPGTCFESAGICNPADGGCLYDPKAQGASCNDLNACSTGDRCDGAGGCESTGTRACPAPPGECFDAGVCTNMDDAGCTYAPRTGAPCSDSLGCTANDVCGSDGSCSGDVKLCTPAVCKTGGTCNEPGGNCTFGNASSGTACDDSNVCTNGTTCDGTGSCGSGSQITCTPSDACQVSTGCDPVNGCQYGPKCVVTECRVSASCAAGTCTFVNKLDGSACTFGTCNNGVCEPNFVPFDSTTPASNFAPDAGMPRTGDLVFNCNTTIDTGDGGVPATVSLCDGGTLSSATGEVELMVQTNGPTVALIRSTGLNVTGAGAITVIGTRPLIFAVYGEAVVAGSIDASGKGTARGPGADNACNAAGVGGSASGSAGSGGGGAAYGATGGPGGDEGGSRGTAGTASGSPGITPLRGGCSGAAGGVGDPPDVPGGLGGGGGGAIQISASVRLTLSGTINVSGGGGRGGPQGGKGGGGGGGGSGGAVLLEAKTVRIRSTARIYSNGGTGGEGGRDTAAGVDGLDGMTGYGRTSAPAGAGGTDSDGGDGGGGDTLSGTTGGDGNGGNKAGGGGGGSSGRLRINFPATADMCREENYVFSPSAASAHGGTNSGFTTSTSLPGASASACP